MKRFFCTASLAALLFGMQYPALAQTVAPPQAKAAGFARLIFDDEFNSLNLSSNGAARAKWYNGVWYESPSPIADFSLIYGGDNSINIMQRRGDPHDSSITTYNRSGNGSNTTFNQGYFEALMRWSDTPDNFAAFWLISSEHAKGTDNQHWCELDIFEAFGNGNYVGTLHDWPKNKPNTNNWQPLPGKPDMNQFHKYGMLWTAQTVSWYFDDKLVMSWPTPAICNQQQLFMILGAQVHPPQYADVSVNAKWVRVWR